MRELPEVRVDLHVHSEYSNNPYSWLLRAARSSECYTTVSQVYETATRRGMDLVTIADHDTIDGARELMALGHSNTFMSEEVSARFPSDGCVVHTILIGLSEAQHDEVQRLRHDIYDLTRYLQEQRLSYFLCHPLSQVNRRLTSSHLEECLLMFPNLELRNGMRDAADEQCLLRLVGGLTAETLAKWAEAHPDTPFLVRKPLYGYVGGSDDHGHLAIARAHTIFQGTPDANGLIVALGDRTTRPGGVGGTAEVLGLNAFSVLAGRMRDTGQLEHALGALSSDLDDGNAAATGLDLTGGNGTESTSDALDSISLGLGRAAWGGFTQAVQGVDLPAATERIGPLIRAALLSVPYTVGARWQARDRRGATTLTRQLGVPAIPRDRLRVVIATDVVDAVDGVSLGLRALVREARTTELDVHLLTAGSVDRVANGDGITRVPSLAEFSLPFYPAYRFGIPQLSAVMRHLVDRDPDLVQCSTPGPVGVVAWIAARMAGFPVVAQFHTDVPAFAARLTGDPLIGDITARALSALYNGMDQVFAPSAAAARRLEEIGVASHRIRRIARGVDLSRFGPELADPNAYRAMGIERTPVVLYAGRLSREKGLSSLLRAWRAVPDGPTLVLVGDGPRAQVLEEESRDLVAAGRVVFAGARSQSELAVLYASADLFVSPSETETFGNAVAEALASGLPAIVASQGAASELVEDDISGLVVDVHAPHAIRDAIQSLVGDPIRRRAMSIEAVRSARSRDLSRAVAGTIRAYRSVVADLADT